MTHVHTRVFYTALGLYLVIILIIFPKWVVDDAYITFRYADNLAHHGALTWNLGEKPVEGYTGIALPLLLAASIKAGLSPVTVTHALGTASFVMGGVVLYHLLRRLAVHSLAQMIPLLLYFTTPIIFTHTFSGLETLPFTTAVLVSVYLACDLPRRTTALFGTLLLASLLRPEGIVLAGICFAWIGRAHRRALAKGAVLYGLPMLAYGLWKWHYYGDLLPNTYYAKTGTFALSSLEAFGKYVYTVVGFPLLLAVALLLINPALARKNLRTKPAARVPFAVIGGSFIGLVGIEYLRTDLIMNFSHRFFVPFFPLILGMLGVLLDLGIANVQQRKRYPRQRLALLFTVCAVGLTTLIPVVNYPLVLVGQIRFTRDMKHLLQTQHIPIGIYLHDHVPDSEWLVVVNDAGAIPYFSQLNTVDTGKLNDPTLARHNLSEQDTLDYIYGYQAGAMVITSRESDHIDYPPAEAIIKDTRFANYTLLRTYHTPGYDDYYEFLFLRNDLLAP